MDQRQAVDQYRHIIAVIVGCAIGSRNSILVDDLQTVIMDAFLVNELDVLALAGIPAQHLHIVLLNQPGLFENAGVGIGKNLVPKSLPFTVRKAVIIQLFQLNPQIGNQVSFLVNG